ncbi:MAG: DUF512 domain-containing protein, partial [Lachnospiraceae bacterium]|nr:DUF512 domain-containing protein [Lachnospiraceae bacterium]
MKGHKISGVVPGSIADEMEIAAGDLLLSVNGHELCDVFDYHYLVNDEEVVLLIRKPDGEEWELEIEKDYNEDIGIVFEDALLDNYKSCSNKCIFCFIDQMPGGMRDTLYFKDDDARLSFLQGNYITLTNMSEADIDRIIRFNLAPINISVHTTNPELRKMMLHNRFAGEALEKLFKLYAAGIEMNSQVVLCKDINDGEELDRTIGDLSDLLPHMRSLSVVPIGLTDYRKNLPKMKKFTKEDALKVVKQIEGWQEKLYKEHGTRFVHASDEFYITAGLPIPGSDYYEGYGQIENGVGMLRSFLDEFEEGLTEITASGEYESLRKTGESDTFSCGIVTGRLVYPYIKECALRIEEALNITVHVYEIVNEFFGQDITVAGLTTGQDIIKQLGGEVPSKAKRPEKENRIEREIDESVYNPDYKKYPEFCKKDCALIIPDS